MSGISLDKIVAPGHSISISDGTNTLAISGSGELTVIATDLDIRDLTHVSDSVKVGDGTDFLAINAAGAASVVFGSTATMNTEAVTVTTTATAFPTTPLTDRRFLNIQNLNDEDIFLVESGATAKAQGTLIPKNSSLFMEIGAGIDAFLISDSSTSDVRILELA